jgi:hypothetical protein
MAKTYSMRDHLANIDGKVLTMDVVIPPKDHEIQIEGIRSLIS